MRIIIKSTLALGISLIVGSLSGCSNTINETATTAKTCVASDFQYSNPCPASVTPLVKHLGVEIARYNPATGKAGVVLLNTIVPKPFVEFGTRIASNGLDAGKVFNHFTYIVDPNAPVYAMIDGIVDEIRYQDATSDYEIYINAIDNTNCCLIRDYYNLIDHLKNVEVQKSQIISAGTRLGYGENEIAAGSGVIEIGLNYNPGAVCPDAFFDPALNATFEQTLLDLMADIESVKSTDYYNPSATPYVGCASIGIL